MTSSRFPIGVAQTASGIFSPSASNATSPAPISPAAVPSWARTIGSVVAGTRQRLALHDLARRIENEFAGRSEAAADDDELRVEDVHERADARPEMAADAVEDLDRPRLPLTREPDEPVRVDRRPELRLCELGRRRSR